MTSNVQTNIVNFLAALNKEDYAKADHFIGNAVKEKVRSLYREQYNKVRDEYNARKNKKNG